jgi:CMP-N,N'-diacetyllegionaminic acid synthase
MNILGIIPARGGSKGVIGKNQKKLSDKPLIQYTIETALQSNLSDVIVSTDNENIAAISSALGIKVPFIRPAEFASDNAESIDVAIHALNFMQKENKKRIDAVMLLQPTTPFRSIDDINNAIKLLSQHKDADSVISVVDVEGHHPARMKYINDGVLIDPVFCEKVENQNRQELDKMYIRNGAIYLTKSDVILNRSYKGNKCMALLMPNSRSINIDTETDFKLAEWTLKNDIS